MKLTDFQYEISNSNLTAFEVFELDADEVALGADIEDSFFHVRRKAMLDKLWQHNWDACQEHGYSEFDQDYSIRLLPAPNGFALRLSREV